MQERSRVKQEGWGPRAEAAHVHAAEESARGTYMVIGGCIDRRCRRLGSFAGRLAVMCTGWRLRAELEAGSDAVGRVAG